MMPRELRIVHEPRLERGNRHSRTYRHDSTRHPAEQQPHRGKAKMPPRVPQAPAALARAESKRCKHANPHLATSPAGCSIPSSSAPGPESGIQELTLRVAGVHGAGAWRGAVKRADLPLPPPQAAPALPGFGAATASSPVYRLCSYIPM